MIDPIDTDAERESAEYALDNPPSCVDVGELARTVIRLADEVERQAAAIQEYIKDGTDSICEIERLREALRFYGYTATPLSLDQDEGKLARIALEESK
jgi:phage host-nuclease inhibitor protein Gam